MFNVLIPDESYNSIYDIDLSELNAMGFKNILIDIDNTIIPWRTNEISKDLKDWLAKCQDLGFTICLFSNGGATRVKKISDELNVPAVPKGGKPSLYAFKRALRYIRGEAKNTVMIGDQIFTDIWGGNRINLYTILVNPISSKEFWGTKLNRFLEKVLANRG